MFFLNPAILFGLIAASIPVIIHLFNLRKLKKIEFSTLIFLKELQKNKIRKIRLKQWLLLALRVLIILFIVFSFARPALKGVNIGGSTSAAKTSSIFILDDTFSMSVVDQEGSYFNQAKSILKKAISNMQEGDEAALLLVSNPDKVTQLSGDLKELEKNIQTAEISYISGDINSALIRAAEIISNSENFNREIYILSDFQKNKIANSDAIIDLNQLLIDRVNIYSVPLASKKVFNLSIDELKINNQIFEKDKPITFSITISNNSEQDVKSSVISVYLNGVKSAQKSFDVESNKSIVVDIEAVSKETGFVDVFAELETDEIEADNKRYNNFFIPGKFSIGMFSDINDDLDFVELALKSYSSEQYEIVKRSINQIYAQQLSNYPAIILSTNELNTSPERLIRYISDGGGVMFFPSSRTDLIKLKNFLNQFNITTLGSQVGQPGKPGLNIQIDKVDYDHPIFKDIFSQTSKKNFESPILNSYIKINPNANSTQIISLMDGSSFLSERKIGNGKLLIFNISPVLGWSDFPVKSIFAPLINKAVFYLASKEREKKDYIAGEEAIINISNKVSSQISVVDPNGAKELINISDNQSGDYLKYSNTKFTGNYKFYSGDELIETISINTDPSESKTEYAKESDIEDYLDKAKFEGNRIFINKDGNISEKIMQVRFGTELWRYFLIIALLLALIEMAVARNTKKDLEGIN